MLSGECLLLLTVRFELFVVVLARNSNKRAVVCSSEQSYVCAAKVGSYSTVQNETHVTHRRLQRRHDLIKVVAAFPASIISQTYHTSTA